MTNRLANIAAAAGLAGLVGGAAWVRGDVFPTGLHVAYNRVPFGVGVGPTPGQAPIVMHQVFDAQMVAQAGPNLVISKIGFAPAPALANSTQNLGQVVVRMGYTDKVPGLPPELAGLEIPDLEGGGVPNATGGMTLFYVNPSLEYTVVAGGPQEFELELEGFGFAYDPGLGNLLVEIACTNANEAMGVSRTDGSLESSRSYTGGSAPTTASTTTALRVKFTFGGTVTPPCYANCDQSTAVPILNVADFGCFLQKFAAGDAYANCDESTTEPVLNVADFGCYLQKFAAGCSSP